MLVGRIGGGVTSTDSMSAAQARRSRIASGSSHPYEIVAGMSGVKRYEDEISRQLACLHSAVYAALDSGATMDEIQAGVDRAAAAAAETQAILSIARQRVSLDAEVEEFLRRA